MPQFITILLNPFNGHYSANIETKPTDMNCESTARLLPSTSTIAILLLLSPRADTYFTIPQRAEGWVDLGTAGWMQQPMSKTVYHNGCRDVYHCQWRDSNVLSRHSHVLHDRDLQMITCSCCTLGLWGWQCVVSAVAVSGSQRWVEVDRSVQRQWRYVSHDPVCHAPSTPEWSINQSINQSIRLLLAHYVSLCR